MQTADGGTVNSTKPGQCVKSLLLSVHWSLAGLALEPELQT